MMINNMYYPDWGPRSKVLMKLLIQTIFAIQTLARSSSEKTQVDQKQLMVHSILCLVLS